MWFGSFRFFFLLCSFPYSSTLISLTRPLASPLFSSFLFSSFLPFSLFFCYLSLPMLPSLHQCQLCASAPKQEQRCSSTATSHTSTGEVRAGKCVVKTESRSSLTQWSSPCPSHRYYSCKGTWGPVSTNTCARTHAHTHAHTHADTCTRTQTHSLHALINTLFKYMPSFLKTHFEFTNETSLYYCNIVTAWEKQINWPLLRDAR